jgi:hypothetical protein
LTGATGSDGAQGVAGPTGAEASGNTLDEAYDQGGAGTGRQIDASDGAVRVNGTDGLIVTGAFNSGDPLEVSGAGVKMFFYPKKGAFRVGTVGSGGIYDATAWDDINIGERSIAMGSGTIASASHTFASGKASKATGTTSTAMGDRTRAIGGASTAMGLLTTASGEASTAMGTITTASGDYSTAMGGGTNASGDYSTAMGGATTAPSYAETAVGLYNTTYPLTTNGATAWNNADRLFVVGNGTGTGVNSSDAMVVMKSGDVGIGEAPTEETAILEVHSTTQGVLLPSMTEAQRDAIVTPATGLLVFQTNNTPGFYYWDGSSWTAIAGSGGSSTGSDANTLIYTTNGF